MTRSSPFDKQYLREQKRAAILAEAAALFNDFGARATRLSDVAKRLGLNQSSLYYYVASKDELIHQTYRQSCDTLGAMLAAAEADGGTGAERIAAFARRHFAAWQAVAGGARPEFAILTEIPGLRPDHRKDIAARYLGLFARVQSLVEAGQADGSLRPGPARDAALAVFGLVQMTVLWRQRLRADEYGRAADAFVDILFRGVSARAGRSARRSEDACPQFTPGRGLREKPAAFCAVGCDSFNRKGFKGTSLDEIAERLKVSKGSFYHHVKDKDDLLRLCFDRSLGLIADAQERAAAAGGSGLDRLLTCAHELFGVQNSADGPLIRFNLLPSLAPSQHDAVRAELAKVSARFGQFIGAGIEDGSLRPVDPLVAEQMLLTAIDVSADLRRLRVVDRPGEAFDSYFGFYFRGLANPAG